MLIIIKVLLVAALLAWIYLGFYLVANFNKLFGAHPDDPSETPGARSFGFAHIVTIWIGVLGLLSYFIFMY
ncbi:hypothetical protein OAB00_03235 [Akkermansiaceae bacterium]|nr:hypothetical protein [Akkermansiaceae bacterium]